jgi:hypothetical protein
MVTIWSAFDTRDAQRLDTRIPSPHHRSSIVVVIDVVDFVHKYIDIENEH